MKIGDVNTGVTYYFPITVKEKKEDKFSSCIVDTDGGEWDEFDVGQLVTRGEIVSSVTDERLKAADDQIDFWKRDSESAHEENQRLQERIKRLEDSNGQYVEQIQKYEAGLMSAKNDIDSKQMTIIRTTKRCADLQTQLEKLSHVKDEAERYKALSESLQQRVNELEADKARPVCVAVKEVETPKVEALRKALRGQGNDIRRKRAIINALAERVVYLEGEMKKNGREL